MGKTFEVKSYSEMHSVAGEMRECAKNFNTIGKKFIEYGTTMQRAWDGSDNQKFASQIMKLADDIEKMHRFLNDRSELLDRDAQNYQDRQNANESAVGGLAQNV